MSDLPPLADFLQLIAHALPAPTGLGLSELVDEISHLVIVGRGRGAPNAAENIEQAAFGVAGGSLIFARKGCVLKAVVCRLHDVFPYGGRNGAARHPACRGIVIIANPHAADEIGRIAQEPRIAVILAGTGLAGDILAFDPGALAGAALHGFAEHRVHRTQTPTVYYDAEAVAVALVDDLAVTGDDAADNIGHDGRAAVGEGSKGGGHFEQCDLRGAECDRSVGD